MSYYNGLEYNVGSKPQDNGLLGVCFYNEHTAKFITTKASLYALLMEPSTMVAISVVTIWDTRGEQNDAEETGRLILVGYANFGEGVFAKCSHEDIMGFVNNLMARSKYAMVNWVRLEKGTFDIVIQNFGPPDNMPVFNIIDIDNPRHPKHYPFNNVSAIHAWHDVLYFRNFDVTEHLVGDTF